MELLNETALIVEQLDGILSLLTNYGFKRVVAGGSCKCIYVNYDKGVVVKRSYLTGSMPDSEFVIPTLMLEKPLPSELHEAEYGEFLSGGGHRHYENILIQPMADTSRRDEAYDFFETHERYQSFGGIDLHSGNVGFYNGKAVLIDW